MYNNGQCFPFKMGRLIVPRLFQGTSNSLSAVRDKRTRFIVLCGANIYCSCFIAVNSSLILSTRLLPVRSLADIHPNTFTLEFGLSHFNNSN